MLLLALDSATSICSAAVCDCAGLILGHRRGDPTPDQADRLIELIDTMLRDAGLGYGALDVIAVNHGPGSFTGIRAGVAAARGLALAAARPVIAVNSLETLAAAVGPQSAGTIVGALDARRGQIYVQIFAHDLAALTEPRALAPVDVVLAGFEPPIRLAGNGAPLLRAALPDHVPVLQENAEADALGVARRAIARIAGGERPVPGHMVQPMYLRAPDARLPEHSRVRATVGA